MGVHVKANPGGLIDSQDVLGRDRLVRRIWEILRQQSVLLTAERRIGKTSVIRKMQAAPPHQWFSLYQDLERVHTAQEFADAVSAEVQRFLGRVTKAANRVKGFFDQFRVRIAGIEVERVRGRSWKEVLTSAIQHLVHQQPTSRLVFLWDEMPSMLDNVLRHEGAETAEEVLDQLRALRHTFAAFRMVMTGSVGLHHVLTRLREAAYANQPTNDMASVDVPPLDPDDAQELARRLICGESLECDDLEATAAAVAREADGVPFYIHHIVRSLRMTGRRADPHCVAEAVAGQLLDPSDPWQLAHYRERIPAYYGERAELVLLILDELAAADRPMTTATLFERVKAQRPLGDRALLVQLLRLAERDHYVARTPAGDYAFRFPLVKRWWRLDRRLLCVEG